MSEEPQFNKGIVTRRMTAEEHQRGYSLCSCGKYAHIWKSDVLKRLPKGYNGEICPECNLWMCDVKYLQENTDESRDSASVSAPAREVQGKTATATEGGSYSSPKSIR